MISGKSPKLNIVPEEAKNSENQEDETGNQINSKTDPESEDLGDKIEKLIAICEFVEEKLGAKDLKSQFLDLEAK